MLNDFNCTCPVYIACGYTDLRRGIDGLAGIVRTQFQMDPFQTALFLFCGRRRDRIKALYWEGDGFLLLYKRLESGSFQWPRTKDEVRTLTPQQKYEAILFPVQALDAVSPPPAEQKQRVCEGVQFKLLLDHSGQTVYSFAQIGVATGDVDLVSHGKVVQHVRRISTSVFSCSGPHCG